VSLPDPPLPFITTNFFVTFPYLLSPGSLELSHTAYLLWESFAVYGVLLTYFSTSPFQAPDFAYVYID